MNCPLLSIRFNCGDSVLNFCICSFMVVISSCELSVERWLTDEVFTYFGLGED